MTVGAIESALSRSAHRCTVGKQPKQRTNARNKPHPSRESVRSQDPTAPPIVPLRTILRFAPTPAEPPVFAGFRALGF